MDILSDPASELHCHCWSWLRLYIVCCTDGSADDKLRLFLMQYVSSAEMSDVRIRACLVLTSLFLCLWMLVFTGQLGAVQNSPARSRGRSVSIRLSQEMEVKQCS